MFWYMHKAKTESPELRAVSPKRGLYGKIIRVSRQISQRKTAKNASRYFAQAAISQRLILLLQPYPSKMPELWMTVLVS